MQDEELCKELLSMILKNKIGKIIRLFKQKPIENLAKKNGGGIYVKKGEVNLTNTTVGGEQYYDETDADKTKGNKAEAGGGIYGVHENDTVRGVIKISGGEVSGNTATSSDVYAGGGIYSKYKLTVSDSAEIKNNKAPNGKGGGIAIPFGGTFEFTGGTVSGNTADGAGGGIYGMKMNGNEGEIIIKGSSIIKRNTANVSNSPAGGGIYASHKLTVEGSARIENNKAPNGDGGGIVCTNNAQVDFTGGTITGNTATRYGKGVYISPLSSGAFNMSGGAKADTNNDVYLDASGSDSAKITVNSWLTPAGGTAACITVPDANYQTTTQVLTGSAVGSEYSKFTVTPQDSGGGNVQNWKVDSSGNLQTQ